MKKKILIIGATGFLGYHIAKFLKKKYIITSLTKNPPKKIRKINDIKYIYGDISNLKSLFYLKKIPFDYVINCGGYVNHINKKQTYSNHFKGCKNLFNIFKNKKISKFIQIGSSSEYGLVKSPQKEIQDGQAKSIYGMSKLKASNFLIKKSFFPFSILRFYQVYGPYQDENRFIPFVINSCLKNKIFKCSHGKQFRDFLYIEDAVKAIHNCIENAASTGKIINIGFGKPIQLRRVIKTIIKKIKKGKPSYGKIKLRPDEPDILFPDITEAKKILSWNPQVSFKKGIIKTIKFYKR